MTVRVLFRCLPVLALMGIAGCAPKIQEQYEVQIVGPAGEDVLARASSAALDLNGMEIARGPVTPGTAFALTATGVDPRVTGTGVLRLRVRDAAGAVLAQGQTPPIELVVATPPEPYRIFVQSPGTLGRAPDLDVGRRNLFAVPTVAKRNTSLVLNDVTVGLFGLGLVPVTGLADDPTSELDVYSPLTHFVALPTLTGTQANLHQPRVDAVAVARNDGSVAVFGGTVGTAANSLPTAQFEVLRTSRVNFDGFSVQAESIRNTDAPGIARSRTALVDTNELIFAFGGLQSGGQALDTVVAINPALDNSFTLLPARMAGPRVGHTATALVVGGLPEILVFGGAEDGAAVAEVFVPSAGTFTAPTGDAGPRRRDHAALLLPRDDATVLLVGGVGPANAVLGDSVLYSAAAHRFSPGPITLQTPRHSFTAFIIENDLVIAGGIGADGALVATAEVFTVDSISIRPKAVVTAYPRWGATATLLGNRSVVLIGGNDKSGATAAVEIYQPNL